MVVSLFKLTVNLSASVLLLIIKFENGDEIWLVLLMVSEFPRRFAKN